MATNDFVQDLVEKLSEDQIEYVVIAIQKGKKEHKANAYYSITTVDGADMILRTIDEIFRTIDDDSDDESDDESEGEYKEGAD
tara:strand:+ start:483 stop:731 length:249 start_codon:yes stop_codon:yes gene_type:complete